VEGSDRGSTARGTCGVLLLLLSSPLFSCCCCLLPRPLLPGPSFSGPLNIVLCYCSQASLSAKHHEEATADHSQVTALAAGSSLSLLSLLSFLPLLSPPPLPFPVFPLVSPPSSSPPPLVSFVRPWCSQRTDACLCAQMVQRVREELAEQHTATADAAAALLATAEVARRTGMKKGGGRRRVGRRRGREAHG
jgi:hypothetical protein